MRHTVPIRRRGAVALLAGVALAALIQPAQAAAAPAAHVAAAVQLRVVTANLFFRGPAAVRADWRTIGPNADVVFVQEAKNVVLDDVLGDEWVVRQDVSADDRQGSAVVVRRSVAAEVGALGLVVGTPGHGCGVGAGILTRWISRADVRLANGRWVRLASLHMPPPNCQDGPGGPYAGMADNVVDFVRGGGRLTVLGADWNKIVDDDPNGIGARSGLLPRGPDHGQRIDGFYVSPGIGTSGLRHLPDTSSDHRPVQMTITVPAP